MNAARRRANSTAPRHLAPKAITKHNRASSEYSASVYKSRSGTSPNASQSETFLGSKSRSAHNLPDLPAQKSFLNLEDSPGREVEPEKARPIDQARPAAQGERQSTESGYSFDQLVDRLLDLPLSKADEKFKAIFLALFRVFVAPSILLEAIISRFDQLDRVNQTALHRTIAQQRYLAVLQSWISNYPGDFAHPLTRVRFQKFLNRLAVIPIHGSSGQTLSAELERITDDDDTDWACSDRDLGPPSMPLDRPTSNMTHGSHASTLLGSDGDATLKKPSNLSLASTDSSLTASSISSNASQATLATPTAQWTSGAAAASTMTLLSIVENAQKSAKSLTPHPRLSLAKIHWHLFMETADDVIAKELTRMDWALLTSIRPRDLVRHVSLSKAAKEKSKSDGKMPGLENVDRMVEHFNRLAHVVSNFVLLREKPKHRGLMLEKWMRVARELRKLNNYNSLGSILAGVHSSPIHRLNLTRELVSQPIAKDFMKLEILMGTAKSHFAYRLAWENSSGERIPYLPLHRRDLVSASEGNKTFIEMPGESKSTDIRSKRINWKKFEIMGDVIVGIQKAQAVPYKDLGRNEDIKMLVLEMKIYTDEDEIYERSVAVEPSGASGSRGKFTWFQRGL